MLDNLLSLLLPCIASIKLNKDRDSKTKYIFKLTDKSKGDKFLNQN
jgi:hypothetical protein